MPRPRQASIPALVLAGVLTLAGAAPAAAQERGREPRDREPYDGWLAEAGVAGMPMLDFEFDERGRERRMDEVLIAGGADAAERARRAGLEVLASEPLAAIGGALVRVRAPRGEKIEATLARAQAALPEAVVAANHVYRLAGAQTRAAPAAAQPAARRAAAGWVGIIDTGVDPALPQLKGGVLAARRFAAGKAQARRHGSTVAGLAVAAGAKVRVADVFDTDRRGEPVASADAIVRAMDWLMAEGAPVINVSIAGPENPVLAAAVRRANARGHVVVAAAGNGGPKAPPAYPAAYPGAVAVTAIDSANRAYRRANQGSYIAFSAHGVAVSTPSGAGRSAVSRTSYAAPLVAAAIARRLDRPSPQGASATLRELQARAVDLGAPGRDPVYGWGRVSLD